MAEKILNEDNLKGNQLVNFRNKQFKTGNRYHDQVELYDEGKFVRTVKMKHITIVKNEC